MENSRLFAFALAQAMAAAALCAAPIPMERAAWEKVQPLGGEFAGGRYSPLHDEAPAFEAARDFAPSSNIVVEASFTPVRKVPTEGNAAIALLESPGRYWHLFLSEGRGGARRFGLTELGGASQIQAGLPLLIDEGAGATWEWGRTYRLRLSLDGTGVEGEVRDDTGALLFRRRYGLAPGHIHCGRPAFKFNRVIGDFEGIEATVGDMAPHSRTSRTPREDDSAALRENSDSFYRTARDENGKWWFVAPDGSRFFLSGIGVVSHAGHYSASLGYAPYARTVARKYPTLEDWATNTLARVRDWGFNFLSSSSAILLRRGFPHAHVVNIGQDFACYGDEFDILPCDGGPCSGFPDVFHPLWPEYCRYRAQAVCLHDRDDPWTLGWYIDNELSWWGDKRQFRTPPASGLFDAAARKAPGHPAREALEEFLKEKLAQSPQCPQSDFIAEGHWHGEAEPKASSRTSRTSREDDSAALRRCVEKGDLLSVPVSVKREFVRLIARKYFEATTAAIREADPNHLILGCRYAGLSSADPVVWEECGRYCDAVSVNIYPMVDLDRGVALGGIGRNQTKISDMLGERARLAGKPAIVTEWCFSALDSGLPCTHGAGQRFFTQKERAEATSIFARTLWSMPECAGYVYFMWCDQPAVGKSGPQSENTNYGLVNADDEPYAEQVAALAAVQRHPEESRAAPLPQEREVVPPAAEDIVPALAARDGLQQMPSATALGVGVEDNSLRVGENGALAVLLREYSRGGVWWSAANTAGTEAGLAFRANAGLPFTLRGTAANGEPFEADVRLRQIASRPLVVAELVAVRNCGTKPLPFDAAYFRLLPADPDVAEKTAAARGDDVFAPPAEGQPTPIPPQLWRPWESGAWILPDGSVLGMLSPRRTGVRIRFWRDPGMHADAEYAGARRTLAVGEEWRPLPAPFVIAAEIQGGGEDAWRALCKGVRDALGN